MHDWKAEIARRLQSARLDPSSEAGIVEELSQHLEDRYEELRAGGQSEADAHRLVLEELSESGPLASTLRRGRSGSARNSPPVATPPSGQLFSDFLRDVKYGLRSLGKQRAFTFFAILTLALGIGASTTIFTVVNTLLLHPFPVRNPSRLVAMYTTDAKDQRPSGSMLPISYENLRDYQERNHVFRALGGYSPTLVTTLTEKTEPERFFAELVTQGYFEALGISPARGRFFLPAEVSAPGSAPVAVLSYNAWKIRFESDPQIIGRTLVINQLPFTVVGVAPKDFIGVSAVFGPDVWLPATMAQAVLAPPMADVLTERGKPFFHVVARLQPGVSLSQSQASLETLAGTLSRQYPDANAGRTISVQPITTALYSSPGGERGMAIASGVLLAIVGLVLLIACSNVANLLMARSVRRRQEIAVRLAVGASRYRLLRQLLTESVMLGLLGGIAGIGVGYEGCRLLWSFRPPDVARNLVDPKMGVDVYVFALLLSLITGLIFGVVPSLKASRSALLDNIKEEAGVAGIGGRSAKFQKMLLIGQVAFSLIALVAASLFLRALQRAYSINPGFDDEHIAVFMMNPEQAGYSAARLREFHREVADRVGNIPGIAAVSWASNLPFWSSPSRGVQIEGREQQRKSETITTVTNTVDVGYFRTLGISLLQGRTFTEGDHEGSLPVVVINEDLARRFWPSGNAVGHLIRLSADGVARKIVGVVATSDYTTLGEAPQPCVYLPLRQDPGGSASLYIRTTGNPSLALGPVQRTIRDIDAKVEVTDVRTGARLIDQILWSARMVLRMLGILGLMALALASVGLYGVLTYSVGGRRREIGLRMALGASRSDVLRLVLRQGMVLVGIGAAIGLILSLVLGRAFSRMLFGLSPADPLSLAGAASVLIVVAILACWLPARAASRVDPIIALRQN